MADDVPKGLDMSLDALIQEKSYRKRSHTDETNGNHRDAKQMREEHGATRVVVLNRHREGQGARWESGPKHPHDEQARCYTDQDTNEVVVKFKKTFLLRVRPNGEVVLSDGGHHNSITLKRMNEALNLIGIRITDLNGTWTVSDGKSLTRFHDGVVLPAKGAATAGRGKMLLAAFNNSHGAMGLAAGALMPGGLPGIPPPFPPPLGMRPPFPGWHPSMGPPPFPPPLAFGGHPFGGRGRGRGRGGRGRGRGRGPEGGGVGGVDVGGVGVERVRRDRAQGRVDPY